MNASRIIVALLATSAAHFALADGVESWQLPQGASTTSRAEVRAQAIEAARSEAAYGRGDAAEAVRAARQLAVQGTRTRAEVALEAREAVRRGLVQQGDLAGTYDRTSALR